MRKALPPDEAVEAAARALSAAESPSLAAITSFENTDERHQAYCRRIAAAVLTAAAPWLGTPEGWVLVPREPEEAMIEAARAEASAPEWSRKIYRAMIDAAPQPPERETR